MTDREKREYARAARSVAQVTLRRLARETQDTLDTANGLRLDHAQLQAARQHLAAAVQALRIAAEGAGEGGEP